jgi:hypothetical protein
MREFFKGWKRKLGVVTLWLATVSQTSCMVAVKRNDPWYPFIYDSIRITTDEGKASPLTLITILLICLIGAGVGVSHRFRSRKK